MDKDVSDFVAHQEVVAGMADGLFASTINRALANGGPDVSVKTQYVLSLREEALAATTKEELAEIKKKLKEYSRDNFGHHAYMTNNGVDHGRT
jgi:hypothetical protein